MAVTEASATEIGASHGSPLRVRWLGRVAYAEAWALQKALFESSNDHLLLLEHPAVYTLGRSGQMANVTGDAAALDAEVIRVDRGGDVTFHGPGQIVGYPIMSVEGKRGGGMADTVAYVNSVEQLLIDVLADLGLDGTRIDGYPGVWLNKPGQQPDKIAAIGVRLSRGRSMHGFALNVETELERFQQIVPCGIEDMGVTSLRAEGVDASLEEVVDLIVTAAASNLKPSAPVERQDAVWHHRPDDLSAFSRGLGPGTPIEEASRPTANAEAAPSSKSNVNPVPVRLRGRLDQAGVGDGIEFGARKPSWMRVKLSTGENYRRLKKTARSMSLTTVCEEAGCPNIFECWNEGTATFMLLGERCTRACGFCLVDTRKPGPVDVNEPKRIAEAVADLDLSFAVLTMVARDDLADGGASVVADTVRAIHASTDGVGVEVLISDLQGSASALQTVCDSEPEIVNHNIETVIRLQRAVRPSASYARSLSVLARARDYGRTTKSGLIVGMGETFDEVVGTMTDLASVGVSVVTVGQYLRPTSHHLPIQRWWEPSEFAELKRIGETELGIEHVAASPLTRSSHHAGSIAETI